MAKEAGMSVPSFCKKKAQGARMRAPKINRQGAFEMARQLRAIGNNVNQLSRRANEGQAIPNEELQSIQKELQALWQQFSEALQKERISCFPMPRSGPKYRRELMRRLNMRKLSLKQHGNYGAKMAVFKRIM